MTQNAPDSETRARLIAAGLRLFGQTGYDGTSTRALAAEAGTNVASISYHFGSKAGLRQACARDVAARVTGAIATDLPAPPSTPDAAQALLEQVGRSFVAFIVTSPDARDIVSFLVREIMTPGEVADIVYTEFLEPRHRMVCALWSIATGLPAESEIVKLSVFAMIGQALYFRIGQPIISRRMGWQEIGPSEAAQIADTVAAQIRATIESQRR